MTRQISMGNISRNISSNLYKTFGILDHTILLSKLDSYGIVGVANNLFKSYLIGKKQYVHSNELDREYLTFHVPQGSVLDPLLF